MSGIYGIINLKNQPIDPSQMNKMEELMIHRGVDGKSQWIENNVGLGHLKLEITPESEYEQLPLKYKQWIITADCRIDNRDELNDPLSILEAERPFTPDSTYIVKAYEKWGKDCVKHLIGDFAFAIWNTFEKTLFCARDHIGIKPFFYLKTEDKFIFASELKTIVELREIPIELNESKLGDWMYRIQDLHNPSDTLFMNIKRLIPAHSATINNSSLNIERYWELKQTKEIKFKNEEDYPKKLRELMIQAVECRMRTKYDIGVTLSGGLDSSSVACIAARKLAKEGKSLYTASSVLPDNWEGIEEDEREYIEAVVNQEKNIMPSYVSAEGKGAFDDLDDFFESLYLPINPFYYIDTALSNSLLKKSNLRVIMNGFYGDTAVSFDGNILYSILINQLHFIKLYKVAKKMNRIYDFNFHKNITKKLLIKILPLNILNLFRKKKDEPIFRLICQKSFIKTFQLDKIYLKYVTNNYKSFGDFVSVSMQSISTLNEEINLRTAYDKVEEVIPWTDIRILTYLTNIPCQQLGHQGLKRGLIRFAMEGILPPKIQWRQNKTMYSPNHYTRIIESKYLSTKIEEFENSKLIPKYINITFIKKSLLSVIPVSNWDALEYSDNPIALSFSFINTSFIKFIEKIIKI